MTVDSSFNFLKMNRPPAKPPTRRITEIRGPYYTMPGRHYLQDLLDAMATYVDAFKFAGGSFSLMPSKSLHDLIEVCHGHDVKVSTGGFIEYVLTQGKEAVDQYLSACKKADFDIIEISTGFITMPADDILRLVEKVQKMGMLAKPEVGIQFGAGGATAAAELEAEGTRDPSWSIAQAKRFLDAGAEIIMIESEGITENVDPWRTDVPARFIDEIGMEKLMFEA